MFPDENGIDGWLRYAPLSSELASQFKRYGNIIALRNDESSPVRTAAKEIQHGLKRILNQEANIGHDLITGSQVEGPATIVIGTVNSFSHAGGDVSHIAQLKEDGFWLHGDDYDNVQILGQNERGALYGAFAFLMLLAQGKQCPSAHVSNPSAPIRWVNQWDNLDGSIERGYAGPSIFFRDMVVQDDLTRVSQYARLMASVGLNGIIVNNVNSHHDLLSPRNLAGLGRIANAMRPWGVRIGVALFFDTPKILGGLSTSDPLDPGVIAFWDKITAQLYQHVPDLIGYLIKANSEGQPGPLTYGRTLADGANMFADALKRHGAGVVVYRAFVYNHHLDESNWKNDRANAAVEYFKDMDSLFEDNVLVQIKYGPIDFQVREPTSPLFAHLRKTPTIIEFQVAQEYLGQQSHVCYLPPLWKTILDFDLRVDGKPSLVRDIVSGERFGWNQSGYAAVVNVGSDSTWLGSHLAMSNLYAYGRYTWDPTSNEVDVIQDWTRLTFSSHSTVVDTVTSISMESWPTYENYTGNLGIQTLCEITKTCHYGPRPDAADGNGWGQWTRADAHAIGMDRTVATGTGYAGQYPVEVAEKFEKVKTTPDDLLLWFHHVPYTHKLKSGKTVIQHFYDAHYEGAANAQTFAPRWKAIQGLIDDSRFQHVLFRLVYQAGHAIVWRDSINEFYKAKCSIPDEQGRVGNYPWRIEAESMDLTGYAVVPITPFEAASGGKAIITTSNDKPGTAKYTVPFESGVYNIAVNYYDHLGGTSQYKLFVGGQLIGEWAGDLSKVLLHDFSDLRDGHSATRITFDTVHVNKGDVIELIGTPDGTELAPIDYVSFLPPGLVD
ncbi:alpha-glucuronidase [Talaromyces stipitatus ATCC 10500]|uniref:Alpha-glucuronidase n=1 Tax=Talaromyces stipitatus (strain ATCC 10500 / CBS 375.48 / QM 6759 / NRRL 1006) TaxID=441959 RepID=B8MQG1_TALSN|nr:alpha-glucuronidase [Talaromyces stipitatus ATCC 10500]EED13363.1 alpha-glucuronidase [Talaromyces stipitatus ATCC 10500]